MIIGEFACIARITTLSQGKSNCEYWLYISPSQHTTIFKKLKVHNMFLNLCQLLGMAFLQELLLLDKPHKLC